MKVVVTFIVIVMWKSLYGTGCMVIWLWLYGKGCMVMVTITDTVIIMLWLR